MTHLRQHKHQHATSEGATAHGDHSCCSTPGSAAATPAPHGHHAHSAHGSDWKSAAAVTVHCLTGCAIGEWMGLAIGVSLGLGTGWTIALAVLLAFITGFVFTLVPLVKGGMDVKKAMSIVWVGEVISISIMEIVMNTVDYHMGGMQAGSMMTTQYWTAFAAAVVAGFVATVPVNYWLLQRNMKKCH